MKQSRPREFIAVPMIFLLLGALFLVLRAAVVGLRDGKVGSPDPLQAIMDALREFPAEEILVPAESDRTLAAETRFGVHVATLTT